MGDLITTILGGIIIGIGFGMAVHSWWAILVSIGIIMIAIAIYVPKELKIQKPKKEKTNVN